MISPTSIFIVENYVFFVVHVLFVSMVVSKSISKVLLKDPSFQLTSSIIQHVSYGKFIFNSPTNSKIKIISTV